MAQHPAFLVEARTLPKIAVASGLRSAGFEGYNRSTKPAEHFKRFTVGRFRILQTSHLIILKVVEILLIPPPTSRLTAITGGPPQSESNDEHVTRMRRFVIIGLSDRQGVGTFKAL